MDAQLQNSIEELGTAMADRIKKSEAEQLVLRERIKDLEQKAARGGGNGSGEPQSMGQQFIASDEFKALNSNWKGRLRISIKSTIFSTGAGNLVPPDTIVQPIVLPRRQLTIRDLLSQGRTASNVVPFTRITAESDTGASVVSEGDLKPELDMTFTPELAQVQTVAGFIVASKQIMDDAPALASTVDTSLRYMIGRAEESELLNGDGTGVHLLGLVPSATAYSPPFTPASPQSLDTLLAAKAQLAAAELGATAVVMNTLDWARLQSIKSSQGEYLGGGPFSPDAPSVWGLAVVATTGIAEDKFLIGDFKRAATLFQREDVTVELSTEDADNFRRNLVTIRCEERLALAITQPAALVYGDFGNIT